MYSTTYTTNKTLLKNILFLFFTNKKEERNNYNKIEREKKDTRKAASRRIIIKFEIIIIKYNIVLRRIICPISALHSPPLCVQKETQPCYYPKNNKSSRRSEQNESHESLQQRSKDGAGVVHRWNECRSTATTQR